MELFIGLAIGLALGIIFGMVRTRSKSIGEIEIDPTECLCEVQFTNDKKAHRILTDKYVIFRVRKNN